MNQTVYSLVKREKNKKLFIIRKTTRGFTLLEIIITFTIIGIMASLGAVNYRERNQAIRLEVAREVFISSFEDIKSRALSGVTVERRGIKKLRPQSWGVLVGSPSETYTFFADEDDYVFSLGEEVGVGELKRDITIETMSGQSTSMSFELFTGNFFINGERPTTYSDILLTDSISGATSVIRINPIGLILE